MRYPIFALWKGRVSVSDFMGCFGEVTIRIIRDHGISDGISETNRRVWVGKDKVGFIGTSDRNGISFNGFAQNMEPK